MFGCECFYWNLEVEEAYPYEPQPFSLPSPLPKWPEGKGFATGKINLGELEVLKITSFVSVWTCNLLRGKGKGVSFYKPVGIPEGYHCLGHYCQLNNNPLRGYVLVARDAVESNSQSENVSGSHSPALKKPVNYTQIWNVGLNQDDCGYFWFPNAPVGYKTMGIVVTDTPDEPDVEEVRCVREDLTDSCEPCDLIVTVELKHSGSPFHVWSTRPCNRGIWDTGVSVGTFYCSFFMDAIEDVEIACLKNLDATLRAMPNLDQVHALIKHYGPTVFFHPDEMYLPSSVQWFFKNGALLHHDGKAKGEPIDFYGSNLPIGGENDGEFWIDLPDDDGAREFIKKGNLESAELYVHVKPALGGTFTDIVMWVFCPFNGPATLKIGAKSITMNRVGEHVGDWEHYTLRVSNFTGELWSMYFSEHSGGGWVDASELEFIWGNKPIVYSSRNGHASFPHPGTYLQGSSKFGIGVRNDCAQSKFSIDSSRKYQIIAAEYLRENALTEPRWLQYMREWGPTIIYDSRSELDKILNLLPWFMRFSMETLFDLFPTELYGEEGPTGPKEKDNWFGDERS